MAPAGRLAGIRAVLWPRAGERALPAVSGLILAASFPPLHPLLPPFVGLVPFAVWICSLSPGAEGRRAAVRGSLVFGAVYFGILFYWILVALIWFTKLAILAFIGSMLLLLGVASLFGWGLHRMVHGMRAPVWLALPIAWTAAEWFRAHWPGSLAFPWLGLGTSLTAFPELVGVAELIGSRGVTFWLALVNGLVAALLVGAGGAPHRPGRATGLVLATVGIVAVPMIWGVRRAQTLETKAVATVAVVQPNVPEHVKLDMGAVFDSTFAALDDLMTRVEPGSVNLSVLPEVTLPFFPRAPNAEGSVERLQAYSREIGAPLIFGGFGFEEGVEGGLTAFNSAFLMEPQGLADYRYDKHHLVPMVERVPLVPEAWLRRAGYLGSYGAGTDWPLARVDETAYAVLICYESSYPEAARSFRLAGADVLVNITNDAWYGREPWYARTSALWQHPAHLVMRAIENRMGVVRSANTGISLFVDPVGRVHQPTRLFEPDVRVGTVETTDVVTFYTRHGDLVGRGATFAALLLVVASVYFDRGRRSLDRVSREV